MKLRNGRGQSYCARPLNFEVLEARRVMANVPAGFTETIVASDLTSPIAMAVEPSGEQLWVAFQDGRLGVIHDDVFLPQLAYTLLCDGSGERGFQGIVLDPDFETNGYIYVYYTAASPESHNRLSRLTVDPTTENTILAGSEVVLLELPLFSQLPTDQSPIWHMGGAIHFLPDESLVVQVGDHLNNSIVQNNNSPLGKILRVNKNGTSRTDNPFYSVADTNPPGGTDWSGNAPGDIDWIDYVWASGLRNPFSGDVDPLTGRYFVNDVGQGTWEEVNDATVAGRNFGWPTTEGNFNPATFPNFTLPFHAYNHGEDCAITGGAFYNPAVTQFPAQYEGMYFFSEFCAGEIMYVNPAAPGTATAFITGAEYPMNIEVSPDGSLYYIARGAGAGGAPGIGTGTIRKVQNAAAVAPQIVQQPASQLVSVGYSAAFAVGATGTAPLSYQWQRHNGVTFVNVPGATSANYTLSNPSLADNGAQYRAVVTNSFGSATSQIATLSVTADTPPTPNIVLPSVEATYAAGDTIFFSGTANDLEDGVLAGAAMTWQVDFHHNVHSHPFLPATSGTTGGQFTIPVVTETDDDVWYRITLTVIDSAGLKTTTFRDVLPQKSNFVVSSNLPGGGGELFIDGQLKQGTFAITGVENVQRTFSVPSTQTVNGVTYFFAQWLDGATSRDRTILTPEDDTAYVALYQTYAASAIYLSDLSPAGTPINGWGPTEFDTSNGEDVGGDGNPITLNGIVYDKGLGVHAYSEVTYNLAGGYSRFLADVGVDDENNPGGTVVFRVLADGNEIFNSGTMANASTTQSVDVSVVGVNTLTLIVDDAGDGVGSDHGDWAVARLLPDQSSPLVGIDFQLAGVPTAAGYLADTGEIFGNRGNGWNYGWSTNHTDVSRDRDINPDQRLDTLVHFHAGQEWEVALPNGQYQVTVTIGDAGFPSTHTLNVEGQNYWTDELLAANNFATLTQSITVSDGRLTLDAGSAPEKATRITHLDISAVSSSSTLSPLTLADLDLNARLDLNDVLAFGAGWGDDGSLLSLEDRVRQGDLDFDGDTDPDDWDIFYAGWLNANNAPLSFDAVINPISGDFNRNGIVTGADLAVWSSSYGSTDYLAADGNGNVRVEGRDFLTWQRSYGASNGQLASVDALVLYIDPVTGEGRLRNDTAGSLTLVGYTVQSADSSLLPSDGQWNSFDDQGLSGWEELTSSSAALGELNPFGSLTLSTGDWRSLGQLADMSAPRHGFSLQFALESQSEIQNGYVVFAEFLESSPLSAAMTSEPQAVYSEAVIVELSDAVPAKSTKLDFRWVPPLAVKATATWRPLNDPVHRDHWFHLYGSQSLQNQSKLPYVVATINKMELDLTSLILPTRVTNSGLDLAIERAIEDMVPSRLFCGLGSRKDIVL